MGWGNVGGGTVVGVVLWLGGAYTGGDGLTTGHGMPGWSKWDGSGRGRDNHG